MSVAQWPAGHRSPPGDGIDPWFANTHAAISGAIFWRRSGRSSADRDLRRGICSRRLNMRAAQRRYARCAHCAARCTRGPHRGGKACTAMALQRKGAAHPHSPVLSIGSPRLFGRSVSRLEGDGVSFVSFRSDRSRATTTVPCSTSSWTLTPSLTSTAAQRYVDVRPIVDQDPRGRVSAAHNAGPVHVQRQQFCQRRRQRFGQRRRAAALPSRSTPGRQRPGQHRRSRTKLAGAADEDLR
jgi:hypothetical protein